LKISFFTRFLFIRGIRTRGRGFVIWIELTLLASLDLVSLLVRSLLIMSCKLLDSCIDFLNALVAMLGDKDLKYFFLNPDTCTGVANKICFEDPSMQVSSNSIIISNSSPQTE
jgi:hypothetical protein